MYLKVYRDQQLFWDEVSPHLLSDVVMNGLCLSVSKTFIEDPNGCLYQSAVFDNGKLMGALVCSQFRLQRNLVVVGPQDVKTVELLIKDYLAQGIEITGVVGEKQLVEVYRPHLLASGMELETVMDQGVYACKKVILPEKRQGVVFRPAYESDVEVVGQFMQEFLTEALPNEKMIDGQEYVAPKIHQEKIFVAEVGGEIVSTAAIGGEFCSTIRVNFVYTPKRHRKNGYASFTTAMLTDLQLSLGMTVVSLFADSNNPTSNKVYQNIGYKLVGESIHLGVVDE